MDAEPDRRPAPIRLQFTGSGSEYFRIWIVNLLLTMLTLGVYSAWAKVRREKYFHQNTRVSGASFDYHGRPLPILAGRVIALLLLALTQVSAFNALFAAGAWLLILLLLPWLMLRSAQFRLANSSYRGLRFRLDARAIDVYRVFGGYLAVAIVGLLAVGLLGASAKGGAGVAGFIIALLFLMFPLINASWRKFIVNHARFGNLAFAMPLRKRDFVRTYLRAAAISIGLTLLVSVLSYFATTLLALPGGVFSQIGTTVVVVAAALTVYAVYFSVQPLVTARLQNLCWNATTAVGRPLPALTIVHRFASDLAPTRFVLRTLRNWVLVVLTLGLYRPFSMVDLAGLRIGAISVQPDASLDTVLADQIGEAPNAVGSEAVDLLGFDISL